MTDELRTFLKTFAGKLRSRAEWECRDGYYTTETEALKNAAMREVYEGIAQDLEEMALPDPDGETPTEKT